MSYDPTTGPTGGSRKRPAKPARHRSRGQGLVEFALIFPIFIVLLLGTIEFAFVFNAHLTANYATRDASLIGAESGKAVGADCVIIKQIWDDMTAPVDRTRITNITIFQANPDGTPMTGRSNSYDSGSGLTCNFPAPTGTISYPFGVPGTFGYPETDRCNQLGNGCQSLATPRSSLDYIGVRVTYRYNAVTPLRNLVGGLSTFLVTRENTMRMEPVI